MSNLPAKTTSAPPAQMPVQQGAPSGASLIPPQAWLYLIGVPIAVGAVYFILVKPLLIKLGAQTEASKQADKINDQSKRQPFWTGNYYKQYGGNTLQTWEATAFASKLYDAMHGQWFGTGMGTDETAIYSVFNTLGSKGNISQVVEQYSLLHGSDLYTDLEDELEPEELVEVNQKISLYAV